MKPAVTAERDPQSEFEKVRVAYDDDTAIAQLVQSMSIIPWGETTICCVGTDRSTGDSLGPLIGKRLTELGVNVPIVGTLDEPMHAVNLGDRLREVDTPYAFAIDACLGKLESVGHIIIEREPLRPGTGVKKSLPEFGTWSMTGIVNVSGFMEYAVLQNTRLSMVMKMANVMAQAIYTSICEDMVRRECVIDGMEPVETSRYAMEVLV